MEFTLHHIGYAVKSIQNSVEEFELLGYHLLTEIFELLEQKISIAFMKKEELVIELVAPLEKESPILGILEKIGCSAYHICYTVDSIDKAVEYLEKNNYLLIVSPFITKAINNNLVCFLYNKNMGLIELLERVQ